MPASPSPVSREASRDFVALDRPFDDVRVQTTNVAVSASTVPANVIHDLIFIFTANDVCISDISDIDETRETGVSDHQGRRKTAELHTSDVKRAETLRGRVKR